MVSEEPRRTGTAWDQLPKIEAEILSDGRVACLLSRDELSIFARAIDVTPENLASRRDEFLRLDRRARIGGH